MIINNFIQYDSHYTTFNLAGAFDVIVFNYYNSVKVPPLTDEEFSNEPNLKRRDRGFFMDFENVTQDEVYLTYKLRIRLYKK